MTKLITPLQLFCVIVLFEMGSAVVVNLGLQAKQDAWIAILMGMCGGLMLVLLYLYIYKHYPNQLLTSYIVQIIGPWLGVPLALIYIIYFIYIAARVLRDFGTLMLSSVLHETPMLMVNLIIMCCVLYAYICGLKVIARAGEIFFVVIMASLFIGGLAIASSNIIRPENLLPILGDGWKPVLSTVFPLTITFPFGETVVFLMLLPYVKAVHLITKTFLAAVTFSGILLSIVVSCDIAILGASLAGIEQFPLLAILGKVNIANFVQRLDPLVISTLIIGVFFKISVFFFAGVEGFLHLVNIQERRGGIILASVIAASTLWLSLAMASSFVEHIEVGLKKVPYYMHIPLQIIIPVILAIIIYARSKMKASSSSN